MKLEEFCRMFSPVIKIYRSILSWSVFRTFLITRLSFIERNEYKFIIFESKNFHSI